MRPPFSPSSRRAPRSTSPSACPGFQLDLGANQNGVDVRGFAGTAGNVVINGARPSTKAETLDTTLAAHPRAARDPRSRSAPATSTAPIMPARARCSTSSCRRPAGIDANVTVGAERRYTGYVNTDISAIGAHPPRTSTINLSAGTGRNKQL